MKKPVKSKRIHSIIKKAMIHLGIIFLLSILLLIILFLSLVYHLPLDETVFNINFFELIPSMILCGVVILFYCLLFIKIKKNMDGILHSNNILFKKLDDACWAISKNNEDYKIQIRIINAFYQSKENLQKLTLDCLFQREKQLKSLLDFPDSIYQTLSAVSTSIILTVFINAYDNTIDPDSSPVFNVILISLVMLAFIGSIILIIVMKYNDKMSIMNLSCQKITEYELSVLSTIIHNYNQTQMVDLEFEAEYKTHRIVLAQLFVMLKKAKGKQKKKLRQYIDTVKNLNLTDYDTSGSYRLGVIIAEEKCCLVCKKTAKTICKHRLINHDYSTLYMIIKESGISISICKP